MRNKILRFIAYLVMPVLYMLLGYGLIYVAVMPAITTISSAIKMLIQVEEPETGQKLQAINRSTEEEVVTIQRSIPQQVVNEPSITAEPENNEERNQEDINIKDLSFPDLGMQYAMLSCGRIQLEVPVYWGDTKEILEVGVGQYIGSFLPGFERTILISGHNNSYFNPLQLIETGDVLVCDTNYGQYKYLVTTVTVMKAEEATASLDMMLSLKKEKIILYTCYPFDTLLANKEKRLFVFGDKISGPKIQ